MIPHAGVSKSWSIRRVVTLEVIIVPSPNSPIRAMAQKIIKDPTQRRLSFELLCVGIETLLDEAGVEPESVRYPDLVAIVRAFIKGGPDAAKGVIAKLDA